MRHSSLLVASFVALSTMLFGCSPPGGSGNSNSGGTVSPGSLTVGLVTDFGGLHDRSYNQMAYQGLKEANQRYGVKYTTLTSTSQSDYVPNLTALCKQHLGLIVAIGYSMESAVYQVATSYPKEQFALVDAAPIDPSGQVHNLPNVANLFFKEQDAGYLVGVIAGTMEKDRAGAAVHNTIGYLGGANIAPVNRYLAGYVAGARAVDPSVQVVGGYAPSFNDPSTGKRLGAQQIARGADILFQVAADTGRGYLQAAQQKGRYGIGVDADQSYLGRYVITSAVKRVDVAVRDTVHSIVAGTFSGGDHLYGMAQDGVTFAPTAKVVPAAAVAAARSYGRRIAKGTIHPPTIIPQS
jgi:basic membrane protein A